MKQNSRSKDSHLKLVSFVAGRRKYKSVASSGWCRNAEAGLTGNLLVRVSHVKGLVVVEVVVAVLVVVVVVVGLAGKVVGLGKSRKRARDFCHEQSGARWSPPSSSDHQHYIATSASNCMLAISKIQIKRMMIGWEDGGGKGTGVRVPLAIYKVTPGDRNISQGRHRTMKTLKSNNESHHRSDN